MLIPVGADVSHCYLSSDLVGCAGCFAEFSLETTQDR